LGSEEGRRRREKKKEKEILRRGKCPVETRRGESWMSRDEMKRKENT
jgi:hypothetical protein